MRPKSRAYRSHVHNVLMGALLTADGAWLGPRTCLREDPAATKAAARKCACSWCSAEVSLTLHVVLPDRKTRDLSNLTKALEDAFNGVAFRDDRQIAALHVTREVDPEAPRVEVSLAVLTSTP